MKGRFLTVQVLWLNGSVVRAIRIIVGKSPDGWYASTSVRGFLRCLLRFLAEVWRGG